MAVSVSQDRWPRPGVKPVFVALMTLLLIVLEAVASAPAAQPGSGPRARRAGAEERARSKEMDYRAWDALLARYVRDGLVDYAAWKKDGTASLDSVLAQMAAHPYRNMLAHEPRLAFLVNAYNAFAIRTILDAYPVKSVKDIPGFFDKIRHPLADSTYTLNDIDQTLIKGRLDEKPEFRFALVFGARGCPPLLPAAYRADSLSMQFGRQFHAFFGDSTNCRYDERAITLHVSELMKWHSADFERGDQTIPRYVAPLFSLGTAMKIARDEPAVEFIPFDWRLNEAPPAGGAR